MNIARIALAALVLSAAATPADAQRGGRAELARRGWLGFSYEDASRSGQRRIVIREVVDDSPAERAGLQAGDTLVTVNDLAVTSELIGSLGLRPGDVVHLGVRRGGRDLSFDLTAVERPAQYEDRMVIIEPDSVRARVRIYLDSMRVHLDSMRLPRIYIERRGGDTTDFRFHVLPRDSFFVFGDSLPNVRAFRFRADTIRVRADSLWRRIRPEFERLRVFGDSAFRWYGDSTWQVLPERFFRADSGGARYGYVRAWPGVSIFGLRAIAGAELTELSPGLAQHFEVDEGVLVLRVPSGTPAERSGIREADIIVAANGGEVSTVSELRAAIARARRSEPVRLDVIRDGERVTVELRRE